MKPRQFEMDRAVPEARCIVKVYRADVNDRTALVFDGKAAMKIGKAAMKIGTAAM